MNNRRIELFQHRSCHFGVNGKAMADNVFVGIVSSVFTDRSATNAVDHVFLVTAFQTHHTLDVQKLTDDFNLFDIARHAIQNQQVFSRLKSRQGDVGVNGLLPILKRQFVGNQFPARNVSIDLFAVGRSNIDCSEYVTDGQMKETWDVCQDSPLSAFADTWRTKQKDASVTLVCFWIS